jgi:hypothetical protein
MEMRRHRRPRLRVWTYRPLSFRSCVHCPVFSQLRSRLIQPPGKVGCHSSSSHRIRMSFSLTLPSLEKTERVCCISPHAVILP